MTLLLKDKRLCKLKLILLKGKTWRYLRYIHLRESIAPIANELKTVAVVGTGHGYAEIALAVEFPNIEFYLTDIITEGYPNYHRAMDICWKWHIDNVKFGVWNILEGIERKFDMICSTEVLEHIKEDVKAAQKMRSAAKKYVYCLVPFGDEASNANDGLRQRVLDKHGHFVFGYDEKSLEALFPNPVNLSGTFFDDAGQQLRSKLTEMSLPEIEHQQDSLIKMAETDLQMRIPLTPAEGQGIKILSKCGT